MRTRVRGQLHGEPTDPAGCAGDQHPLAQDRAGGTQRPQRGDAGHRRRRRFGQINRGRDLGQRADLDRAALGEGPGAKVTTRVPAAGPRPSAAACATTPAASDPSTPPGATRPERASLRSPWFSDAWCTSSNTWLGPDTGSGTSARRSAAGADGSTMIARIGTSPPGPRLVAATRLNPRHRNEPSRSVHR